MSEQKKPKQQYWFPEDTARFEAWLKEWNHQLGSGRWSIYTFAKAAFKAGTVYERKKQEVDEILKNIRESKTPPTPAP